MYASDGLLSVVGVLTPFSHIVSLTTHASAIATDLLVVVLTWIKTFSLRRAAVNLNLKASLSTVLLRDGSVYFVYVPD